MNNNLIQENVSLADKNWFCTGGHAKFFVEPETSHQFAEALAYANLHDLAIFVLGEGANILISDEGFDGLVIRPHNKNIEIVAQDATHGFVRAGAGVNFGKLINFCLDQNLSGLEEFSGIPGTVGGSVFINIHFFQFLLSQFLHEGTIINRSTGIVQTVSPDWFNFGYNHSTLHTQEYFLIEAIFKLKKVPVVEAAYSRGRRDEMIRYRGHRYPKGRTCGSFFRNFHEHEVSLIKNGKKVIYAAYYLDTLGIKGQLSYGNASISHQHANMIVTHDGATSVDVINLARTMQELVYEKFGLLLEPEFPPLRFP